MIETGSKIQFTFRPPMKIEEYFVLLQPLKNQYPTYYLLTDLQLFCGGN